ncbi:insulinase family protein [Sphingopyxis fribergensis]
MKLRVNAGHDNETAEQFHAAHIVEHYLTYREMGFFENPARVRYEQFRGSTSYDETNYSIKISPDRTSDALAVLASMMTARDWPLRDFDIAKSLARAEAQRHQSSTPVNEIRAYRKLGWNSVRSTVNPKISALGLDDAVEFYETWYQPDNISVAISTSRNLAQTLAVAEGQFSKLSKTAAPKSRSGLYDMKIEGDVDVRSQSARVFTLFLSFSADTNPTHIDDPRQKMIAALASAVLSSRFFAQSSRFRSGNWRALAFESTSIVWRPSNSGSMLTYQFLPAKVEDSLSDISGHIQNIVRPALSSEVAAAKQKVNEELNARLLYGDPADDDARRSGIDLEASIVKEISDDELNAFIIEKYTVENAVLSLHGPPVGDFIRFGLNDLRRKLSGNKESSVWIYVGNIEEYSEKCPVIRGVSKNTLDDRGDDSWLLLEAMEKGKERSIEAVLRYKYDVDLAAIDGRLHYSVSSCSAKPKELSTAFNQIRDMSDVGYSDFAAEMQFMTSNEEWKRTKYLADVVPLLIRTGRILPWWDEARPAVSREEYNRVWSALFSVKGGSPEGTAPKPSQEGPSKMADPEWFRYSDGVEDSSAIRMVYLAKRSRMEMPDRDLSRISERVASRLRYRLRYVEGHAYPGLFGAYNAGPARYAAALSGKAPLPGETRRYIAAVAEGRSKARSPAKVGLTARAGGNQDLSLPPSDTLFFIRRDAQVQN